MHQLPFSIVELCLDEESFIFASSACDSASLLLAAQCQTSLKSSVLGDLDQLRTSPLAWMRQLHLYLGVFSAPAILFFAFTGVLQTFSLHENARDGSYQAPAWIKVLAQIHKKQTYQVPIRKPMPLAGVPLVTKAAHPKAANAQPVAPSAQSPRPAQHNPLPLRIFFLVVGISLALSTFTGLWMSWKYRRSRALLYGLFVAGVIVPIVLMWI